MAQRETRVVASQRSIIADAAFADNRADIARRFMYAGRAWRQRVMPMTPKELERRLFFIKQIVMGCIRQYLQHPPSRLSRREFVDDLSRILVPYIKEVSAQQ